MRRKLFRLEEKKDVEENSGNYIAFRPEFSNGQFGKTGNTIAQIVHNEKKNADPDLIIDVSNTRKIEDTIIKNVSINNEEIVHNTNNKGDYTYIEEWKLFKDLTDEDKVQRFPMIVLPFVRESLSRHSRFLVIQLTGMSIMNLNHETGEKEWEKPFEKQEFEHDGMYRIELKDEISVGEKDGVYANLEDSNLSSYNIINLPLNSSGFVSLSNLENKCFKDSILRCGILSQINENISLLLNSRKSSSLVTNILCSDLENSANLPFVSPLGLEITSTPSFLRNLSSLLSTFSSNRNLIFEGDINNDIFFTSGNISCILQSCSDMFFSQRGESLKDFFELSSVLKHFKDLPDHNSCAFESKLSMANLTVRYNVFVDFDSHKKINRVNYINVSSGVSSEHMVYYVKILENHALRCVENLEHLKVQNKPHLLRCGKTQGLFDINITNNNLIEVEDET